MRRVLVSNEELLDQAVGMIDQGQTVTLLVKGNSMRPFLCGGTDSVVLSPIERLMRYDIVLAYIGQRYVLHRIIKINGDRVTLMGDGNLSGTEICRRTDVKARTSTRIRNNSEEQLSLLKGKVWVFLRPVRRILLYLFNRYETFRIR